MQSVVQNLNETYEATPRAVAEARTRLAGFAAAAGAGPDQVDAVRLATSEAMTNCILHAYGGEPGEIQLNAAVTCGELWILISDAGRGLTPRTDRPGLGLGLGLISQVSDDFTIVSRPSGGTEVRIRFNLGEDGPGPRSDSAGGAERPPRGFTPMLSATLN
jgi:anti-sigma regulatory factor (Ser/Thr protein kinase)